MASTITFHRCRDLSQQSLPLPQRITQGQLLQRRERGQRGSDGHGNTSQSLLPNEVITSPSLHQTSEVSETMGSGQEASVGQNEPGERVTYPGLPPPA